MRERGGEVPCAEVIPPFVGLKAALANNLLSVRPDSESVRFDADAGASAFCGCLVAEAGVPSHVVVFAAPVGEFDAGVQEGEEDVDVEELVAPARVERFDVPFLHGFLVGRTPGPRSRCPIGPGPSG